MANNPSFDPNLGVLSMVQGVGNAMNDIGKMGMMDSMETRRSQMESKLKGELQGQRQDFLSGQAETKNLNDVEAATVKNDRDVMAAKVKQKGDLALQASKNEGGTGSGNVENKGVYYKDGVSISESDMNSRYKSFFGMNGNAFIMPKGGIPSQDEWAAKDGWLLRGAPPPPAPTVLDEKTYRERYLQHKPDATDEEVRRGIETGRQSGLISAAGTIDTSKDRPEVANPMGGILDEVAGTVDNPTMMNDAGVGVLAETKVTAEPKKKGNFKPYELNRARGRTDRLKKDLMKHESSKVISSNRRGKMPEVDKAAKQVRAALQKGNIMTISKDRLKIALKNQSLVDGLSNEELRTLIDYLEQ